MNQESGGGSTGNTHGQSSGTAGMVVAGRWQGIHPKWHRQACGGRQAQNGGRQAQPAVCGEVGLRWHKRRQVVRWAWHRDPEQAVQATVVGRQRMAGRNPAQEMSPAVPACPFSVFSSAILSQVPVHPVPSVPPVPIAYREGKKKRERR